MREHALSCKSIPAHTLLEVWVQWERSGRRSQHPINGLAEHYGCDRKLILAKLKKLTNQGYLDHGTSPWTSWVTAEGHALLEAFTGA